MEQTATCRLSTNKRVLLCRLDTESTFKLKALANKCCYSDIREAFNFFIEWTFNPGKLYSDEIMRVINTSTCNPMKRWWELKCMYFTLFCACMLFLTFADLRASRHIINLLTAGMCFEVDDIIMMSPLLFIVVTLFRKPLRLFLEYDRCIVDYHVKSSIYSRDNWSRGHNLVDPTC